MLSRREVLRALGTGALLLRSPPASGSVARALGLGALVAASRHVVVARPVEAWSRWERVAGRRRIVTFHRLKILEQITAAPAADGVLVRTLGGQVGDVGQVVHGEAVLPIGAPGVTFLAELADGVLAVTAMAQGSYPLVATDRGERLAPNPGLGELVVQDADAAVTLIGQPRAEAIERIRRARTR